MNKYLILSLMLVLSIIACKQDTKNVPDTHTVAETPTDEETAFKHEAQAIEVDFSDTREDALFAAYIRIKTALINTDAEVASEAGSQLLTAYSNLGVEEEVFARAVKLTEATDIEAQRMAFSAMTDDIQSLLADAIEKGAIYRQFCPMAFENKGAYWLSESSEIANPYFGDKMYRCGVVKEKIEK